MRLGELLLSGVGELGLSSGERPWEDGASPVVVWQSYETESGLSALAGPDIKMCRIYINKYTLRFNVNMAACIEVLGSTLCLPAENSRGMA